MFTLQSMMLVALGILVASLVVIAVLPAYRGRIQRLTTDRIRRSVPLTEAEIRADKDKLRAQYAIRVHKLEAEGDQAKLAAARQRIEMNRRDARITELQDEMERIRAALEENVNARRVLEHTVTDRLPRLEQQLESARSLIQDRDEEMVSLKAETTRSVRALDEAMQLNVQQRAEMDRLLAATASRVPAAREAFADSRFDGEIALRSEIEALRAKTREQAQHIMALQGAAAGGEALPDVERLKRELADAEAALKSTRDSVDSGQFDRAAAEAQAKALNARIDEQAAEIARLNAAVAVYEGAGEGSADRKPAGQASRLASRAKISALQAQIAQQNDTMQRLRGELAASNERLARQAAHYMEEMRRLGSGTMPTSLEPRRGRETAPRRSLSDRISQAPRAAAVLADSAGGPAPSTANGPATSGRVAEYIKALSGDEPAGAAANPTADKAAAANGGADHANGSSNDNAYGAEEAAAPPIGDAPKRKPRLLERISGLGKA